MQEQMRKKDPKENGGIKNTVTEMRNMFDGFINKLNIAEKESMNLKKRQQKLKQMQRK